MANSRSIEALKGTWDHVADENMDEFMKELGVGMAMRVLAKGIKPRIMISENNGKWTLRSESTLKKKSVEFIPDVEFDDTTPDGREVKTIIRFKNGAWEHTTHEKSGKEWTATRYVNDEGQQQVDMKYESVTAHRRFKRVD
ncbi:unnamed protein product [Rotaria socialis]|uniref:Uncharacterized protein n=1 Tax=Rotaria socialis TaxID=392032 RepID=A0A818H417_9BILA|nr:unnamed protein product [Rotaria socialis]CAF3405970.1 unnamed protein product [Rotaria socialis]CAF3500333.1 unnamed protein product [Rotaria socialis]CAF3523353.1 unnamed protein product [Rotaria socialis]CAF3601349.1 unnamed protein product [Rotaria socialis]